MDVLYEAREKDTIVWTHRIRNRSKQFDVIILLSVHTCHSTLENYSNHYKNLLSEFPDIGILKTDEVWKCGSWFEERKCERKQSTARQLCLYKKLRAISRVLFCLNVFEAWNFYIFIVGPEIVCFVWISLKYKSFNVQKF